MLPLWSVSFGLSGKGLPFRFISFIVLPDFLGDIAVARLHPAVY